MPKILVKFKRVTYKGALNVLGMKNWQFMTNISLYLSYYKRLIGSSTVLGELSNSVIFNNLVWSWTMSSHYIFLNFKSPLLSSQRMNTDTLNFVCRLKIARPSPLATVREIRPYSWTVTLQSPLKLQKYRQNNKYTNKIEIYILKLINNSNLLIPMSIGIWNVSNQGHWIIITNFVEDNKTWITHTVRVHLILNNCWRWLKCCNSQVVAQHDQQ